MVSPVDPNEIRLTGENSSIRLMREDGGPLTAFARHWRMLHSPAGPGHILFLQSEITDNQVRIYSDNIAMTRWLQGEIENTIHPDFGNQDTPVTEAVFSRQGNLFYFYTERAVSRDEEVTMTWYDFGEPFLVRLAPGSHPVRPNGAYFVLTPARGAQVVLNGRAAPGRPFPAMRDEQVSSTATVAFSETWVRPR